MWFSGEGGGRDLGESLKGFGEVLKSGLAKQICQGTPQLTVGKEDSVPQFQASSQWVCGGLRFPAGTCRTLSQNFGEIQPYFSSGLCVIRKAVLGSMIQKQEA